MNDEKKYPMSYDEFKKRLIELFLTTGYKNKKAKLKFLEELLKDDPDFIKDSYDETCYRYDRSKYKNSFDDEMLIMTPVNVLEMLF